MAPFTSDKVDHDKKEETSKVLEAPHISNKESPDNKLQNIQSDEEGKWPSLPGLFLEPAPLPPPPTVRLINLQTRKCWIEPKKRPVPKINNFQKVTHDSVEFLMDISKLDEEHNSISMSRIKDFCRPITGNMVDCSESHSQMSLETFYLDDFGKMEGMKLERKLLKELSCVDVSSPFLTIFKGKNTLKNLKNPAVLKQTSFSPKRFFKRKMVKRYDSEISVDDKDHTFVTPSIQEKEENEEEEKEEPKKLEEEDKQMDIKNTSDKEISEERLPLPLSDNTENASSSPPIPPQAATLPSPGNVTGTTFNEEPLNKSDYDIPSDHNKTATRNGLHVTKTQLILVKQARLENRVGAKMFA